MAPKVQPRVPNAKIRIEDVITKDGKFDSNKFWKLTDAQIADLIGDAVHDIRTYIVQPTTAKKAASSVRLLEALDKENPDLGLSHYVTLFKSMESGNGSALTKSYFDSLKQYDPDTFNLYLKYPGWESYDRPDFDFTMYKAENMPKDAEPSTGVLTDKPLNNASPAESAPGALTNPPAKLPEATPEEVTGTELNFAPASSELPKKVTVISNKPMSDEEMLKLMYPKEGVVVGPETSKPGIDTPLAEGNSVTASSPEAKVAEGVAKTEDATGKTEAKTPSETPEIKEGALTGKDEKPTEPSKGVFGKTWDFLRNHKGKIAGWGLGTPVVLGGATAAIHDLASDDSTIKSWFTKGNLKLNANNPSANQPRIKSLDQREGAYMPERLLRFTTNEEYVPGKIPSHIPQDNLDEVKESSVAKKSKSQPQAPAPVNNATADYVRAAYNSYIPSDAGRAYQKAIYGDPLELDRMRLQQQQQKWRDFVMRSGQSPAELVQRGLMPYDALQYV